MIVSLLALAGCGADTSERGQGSGAEPNTLGCEDQDRDGIADDDEGELDQDK